MRTCKGLGREVLNHIRWGWFEKEGVCFFREKGRAVALWGYVRNMFHTILNLVVDTALCRVTSYGDETLVTETDCKNNWTFFFFILFCCRRKNKEKGHCTRHECLTDHGASVGQCFWLLFCTCMFQVLAVTPTVPNEFWLVFIPYSLFPGYLNRPRPLRCVLFSVYYSVSMSHTIYKVVQILPGQTVACLHTISPGHIWTTLNILIEWKCC